MLAHGGREVGGAGLGLACEGRTVRQVEELFGAQAVVPVQGGGEVGLLTGDEQGAVGKLVRSATHVCVQRKSLTRGVEERQEIRQCSLITVPELPQKTSRIAMNLWPKCIDFRNLFSGR